MILANNLQSVTEILNVNRIICINVVCHKLVSKLLLIVAIFKQGKARIVVGTQPGFPKKIIISFFFISPRLLNKTKLRIGF